jgi:hypothetical protein
MDQIVQGPQRRDPPAGRDIDVGAEGADPGLRIALRVGVDRDVALVQMGDHGLGQRTRRGGVGDLSAAIGSSEISMVTEAPCGS